MEDGATTATVVKSDATGKATYTYAKPGSVHVLEYNGGIDYFVTSVMSVSAGDTIAFTGGYKTNGSMIQGVQGKFAPATLEDGGTTSGYGIGFGNCTTGGTFNDFGKTFTYGFYEDCLGTDGKLNMLFDHLGDNGLDAYVYRSLSVTLDAASQLQEDIASADYVLAPQLTETFNGTRPTWAQVAQTNLTFPVDGVDLVSGAIPHTVGQSTYTFGSLQASLAPVLVVATLLGQDATKTRGRRVRRLATGSFTEDFSAFLPRVTGATVDANAASPTVTWTEESPFTVDKTVNLNLTGVYAFDGSTMPIRWNIVFPAGKSATSATIPALPTELASYVATSWSVQTLSAFASPQAGYGVLKSLPDEGNDLTHLVRDLPASLTSAEIRQSSYENIK